MGLWRLWTISHGRLDYSSRCLCGRGRLAPAIRFFVMTNRNGAVTSAVPSALTRGPAHFAWHWRERPALALLAWDARSRSIKHSTPHQPRRFDLPQTDFFFPYRN